MCVGGGGGQKVSTPLKGEGTKSFTLSQWEGGGGAKVSDSRFSHFVGPPPPI